MSELPLLTVLCGSLSDEAEVSRVSGRAVADALRSHFRVDLIDLVQNELPGFLDAHMLRGCDRVYDKMRV